MSVQQILQNWTPGYVPPVSWEALARTAHQQNLKPQPGWPQPMKAAYQQTKKIWIAAAAETSAYLVSQGMDGELEAYAPFSDPALNDVMPAEDRDDWIGA